MLNDFVPGRKISLLEEAFNRNLLPAFLLVSKIFINYIYMLSSLSIVINHNIYLQANLLTGLVNLSMDTLSASTTMATCILMAYTFVLSITAGIADFNGIKLKLGWCSHWPCSSVNLLAWDSYGWQSWFDTKRWKWDLKLSYNSVLPPSVFISKETSRSYRTSMLRMHVYYDKSTHILVIKLILMALKNQREPFHSRPCILL